jgi:hypothetical protein
MVARRALLSGGQITRRAFLFPVHVGGLLPILFTDDSLRHTFTRSGM